MTRIHLAASVAALIVGAIIAWLPKGTRLHRRLGWSYGLATGVRRLARPSVG